jgi:peptidoglycan hydrolase-like protein with peptidoglycan-binding domain
MEDGERGVVAAAIMAHPREFVAIVMAVAATGTIFFNALFLQHGPHPAPIFARHMPALHRSAPDEAGQHRARLVTDIQRELSRRGFYDDAVDGVWGVKTDAAAREFLQAAGLKAEPEVSDGLLRTIKSSSVRRAAAHAPAHNDPIARLLAPSKRMQAIQSALADFGYGQIKPTGVYDDETRAAIEKFERDQRMPVTGQLSERVVRALAAMTGRPLE